MSKPLLIIATFFSGSVSLFSGFCIRFVGKAPSVQAGTISIHLNH